MSTINMSVKLTKIENMCHTLRTFLKEKKEEDIENYEIGFEYVIASLFPGVYDNIINELKRQYTIGFIKGQNSIEEKFEKK